MKNVRPGALPPERAETWQHRTLIYLYIVVSFNKEAKIKGVTNMDARLSELEKVKKKFEDVGLYLDEIEWDTSERLRYASMPLEDWANSYIRRYRPNGLTPEIAKSEIQDRKRKTTFLKKELLIQHGRGYVAAYAAACSIAGLIEMQNILHISSFLGFIGEFIIILGIGLMGTIFALILSSAWSVLAKSLPNLKFSYILMFFASPLIAMLVAVIFALSPPK